MAWARLDDSMTFHPKVIDAGNEAIGIWARMLSYCNCHLTDGVVPESVARGISTAGTGRFEIHRGPLRKLLESGLATRQENGDWVIHDFLDWNESRAEVLKKRKAAADKKARQRSHMSPGDTPDLSRGPSQATTPTPLPLPQERDRSLSLDLNQDLENCADDNDLTLEQLDRFGFQRTGAPLGGSYQAKARRLHPVKAWEMRAALATNGRSWGYLLKVIESTRQEASLGNAPPAGPKQKRLSPKDQEIADAIQGVEEYNAAVRAREQRST